jgi:class 3 adenylate cyclase
MDGVGTASEQAGMEHPGDLADAMPLVDRAFAFVDLCGFTRFIDDHGEHAAIDTLSAFRNLTRGVATRRGVRVAKWLGDGAMLVGVEVGRTIAAAGELIARHDGHSLPVRGGFAHGSSLIFDGDDYIGRPANLAARFCQAAQPGELLAVGYPAAALPPWMQVLGTRQLTLRGLGSIRRAQRLGIVPDLALPALSFAAPHRGSEPQPRALTGREPRRHETG